MLLLLNNSQLELIFSRSGRRYLVQKIEPNYFHGNWIKKNSFNIQSRTSREKEYLRSSRTRLSSTYLPAAIFMISNFCQEFYAEGAANRSNFGLFEKLNADLTNTFCLLFQSRKTNILLSASPERFLAKRNQKLISQPIKGTAPRSVPVLSRKMTNRKKIVLKTASKKGQKM